MVPAHPLPTPAPLHGRGRESRPGTNPDRCGFTIAFQSPVTCSYVQRNRRAGHREIGRRLLAALLPAQRLRVSARKVSPPSRGMRNARWTVAPVTAKT